uniref:BTB domain-containing protein n=1 Tax=Timema cristinae TaxID=61476 RepID=A0A7R9D0F9_TIMCR|nr:unnamed protein product [Timema cristinae]
MSKSQPERDCTHRCVSRQHGALLGATVSKRGNHDSELAAYLHWLCYNCGLVADVQGRTALHVAASCGRRGVVHWLIKNKGANINARDIESGYTPLHRSVFYGQIHVATELIELGANMSVMDYDDLTPLDHAMKDRLRFVEYSLSGPCEVYVWGTNTNYTLGTGGGANRTCPELLDSFRKQGVSVKQVAMHKFHSVFVSHDGRVFSCGHGQGGRLGLDSEQAFLTPRQVRLVNNSTTGIPEVCVQASVGRDHTVLLTETGMVLTCGLNAHHQLGHSPPPPFLLVPRPLPQKVIKAAGPVSGICAARFHTVVWSPSGLLTFGLNAGPIGPLKDPRREVSSLNHKDCHITHVAASDGATVVVVKKGDIYLLHEYQCRKIASRQLNVAQVGVIGGTLDSQLDASTLMDRGGEQLRVAVLTKTGKLLLWQESSLQLTRCIFTLNRLLIFTDLVLTRHHLLLVTKDGEVFQGEVKQRKPRKQPQDSAASLSKSPLAGAFNKPSAFHDFLEKDDCEVVMLKKLPHIHRAVSVTADLKGRNFAVIQSHPKASLLEVPQIETSNMRQHMMNLLHEAHPDDAIHDVEFQVGPTLCTFPAHRFMISSRSEPLAKMISECSGGDKVPKVKLPSVHPEIFERILTFIYTNSCDLLRPGTCSIRIPKSNNIKTSLTKNDDMLLENERSLESLSAFAVYSSESVGKKVKSKQKKVSTVKSQDEENVCSVCDPVRLAQEAAKKFGLSTLHKKLEGVRFENGAIVSKTNRSSQPANLSLDRNKHRELYDVTIHSKEGRELRAHKCVLAARLEYFNNMFGGGWAETSNSSKPLIIPIPYNILEAVVGFLYQDEAAAVQASEDLEFVCDVLAVADQLFVERLKEVCEAALGGLVTLKNVAQLLELSGAYNADQLKRCCMQYICLNLPAVLEARSLEIVSENLLEDLSKYYQELNTVMCKRIITPYSAAPSDTTVRSVWDTHPISWGDETESCFIDDRQKTVRPTKKKPRTHRISGGEYSKNTRSRNVSVSSNEDVNPKQLGSLDFNELTEKHFRNSVSASPDITLSLTKVLTDKQQKVVQARLKVLSAAKETPSLVGMFPETFTKLVKNSPLQTPVLLTNKDPSVDPKNPKPGLSSNSTNLSISEERTKTVTARNVCITSSDFPELQKPPTSGPQETNIFKTPPKQSESSRIQAGPHKQRKKLAAAEIASVASLAEHLDRINQTSPSRPSWAPGASPEKDTTVSAVVGSPTTSYSLLDLMKQEFRLNRQGSAPIAISPAAKKLSWSGGCASSPTDHSPPVTINNPWLRGPSPPFLQAASPPPASFTDIVADERKQRDNWTKMRAKPLQLTQLEDQAMEDLLVFYNAAGATDERITVRRVLTGAVAAPTWITSHH